MTLHIARHALPAALALLIVMVGINTIRTVSYWWRELTPPITWGPVRLVTPTVRPGGELKMIFTHTINRQCPADLRRFLVAPDGSVPVRYPTIAGGYTKPTDGPVDTLVSLIIPTQSDNGLQPLHSGKYIYRAMAIRFCPEGIQEDRNIPDVPFDLVAP